MQLERMKELCKERSSLYEKRNDLKFLDRGYFSRENIRYMDKCGYDFVIMVKGMKSFVK